MRSSWQHALDSTRFAFVLALINTRFRAASARRLDSRLLMPIYPFFSPPQRPYPLPLQRTDTQLQFVCVDCSVSTVWATRVSPRQGPTALPADL